MTGHCPHCHQTLANVIGGVKLPPLKARLITFIETHPGLSAKQIATRMAIDHQPGTIKSHISQINRELGQSRSTTRILGRSEGGYRVVNDEVGQGVGR